MGRIIATVLILFIAGCSSPNKIGKSDIRHAEKLVGLTFSGKEITTMKGYLADNRKGYDSMRKVSLNNSVQPASYFDPRPDHFKQKVRENAPSDWKLGEVGTLPEKDEEIAFLSVAQLGQLIKAGKLTSSRLTRIYLDRLKKYKDTLYAVVTTTDDLALRQAERADDEFKRGIYRGQLHGIPYGIKDLFSVPGYKTTPGNT